MESKIVIALISLDLFKYETSFWDHQHWIEWAMTRDNVSQNAVSEYQIVKEGFRKFCEENWSRALAEDGTGIFDFDKKIITNRLHKQIAGFLPNFESPELIDIWRDIQMNLLRRISYLTFSRANFHLVNMISTETQKFIQEWNSKNDNYPPFNNFLNQANGEFN